MFLLGSLVVLCSLLSGTSESRFGSIGSNNMYSLNSFSEGESIKVPSLDDKNQLGALNIPNIDSSNIYSPEMYLWVWGRFQINKLSILDILAGISSNQKGIDLKLPLVVTASVSLPLIGPTANISVSLDIISSLTVQTDALTRLPTLAIGKCSSDAEKNHNSLFDRQNAFVKRMMDGVSGLLTNTVSNMLQNEICPLLQVLLRDLNINLTQDLLCKSQFGNWRAFHSSRQQL
uniref:Lipid-binding serum glycoprotein N-terminal domain-containing protein n=1 Tax=Peromyscus maniculatus bairdii TaxID=230844 RepID=A0A8C8UHT5_PERMB